MGTSVPFSNNLGTLPTTMNKTIRKIHLWLGLTCGLIVSFSGLSGSLYVWQPEISALINPDLLQVEDIGDLDERAIMETTASLLATHGDSINSIFLPYREQQTISVQFNNGKTCYYHPETHVYLGGKSVSILFFENLLVLHRTLGIPTYGKYIVRTSAILFFLFLLTSGIYIWTTSYRNNLKEGFTIKWKGKRKKVNFDLHKVFGAYFMVPLLIMALSGSYFTYNYYYKSALSLFDDNRDSTEINVQQSFRRGDSLRLEDHLLSGNEAYALRAIHFPKDTADPYRFRYIKERFITSGLRKTKEVELDAKGRVTVVSDFRTDPNSNRMATQFYPIHIGEMAGTIGRILVFVSGLVPLLLFITGLNIYRNKKRRKTRKKDRM
ncbi:PepSY-associated TM helix domain protein [Allomuricauda ruestringensis DSM 13258]|uniref:PepSY-associated TM helix domain protein n=1 Tax=Allomuricauda ruestringensis (strain DSM 13258 / CIP 107369 / LMG 19739 / B1) TaxID=886377 RepID=G2PN04_ALLRU|nr:PepSY-associated TM helix domain-containing protein [Allomuricauda ruestringensis]AEM72352.1 PepSY-associated TM helix domain protein [Allomuricauda ruestringensis DSM 13258]